MRNAEGRIALGYFLLFIVFGVVTPYHQILLDRQGFSKSQIGFIFGALVLRAVFIFAGVALLNQFSWLIFVFGGFLLVTAVRLLFHDDEEVHPENNPVLKLVRRVIPSTAEYDGQHLFTRRDGALLATPLFAVLIVVETSDVVFAVDSIPAILAVTRNEFVVFTSNAFAILGLRALYFLLADLQDRTSLTTGAAR